MVNTALTIQGFVERLQPQPEDFSGAKAQDAAAGNACAAPSEASIDSVSGDLTLVMPNGQNVTVFPGTPGVVQCDNLTESYQCAVLGQSLGDTIVWFALMPMRGAEFRFELPAIVELDEGFARLANGWEVPYAQVIDRTECDPDAASFADFLDKHGTEFVSIYDLSEEAIVAVAC